MNCVKQAAEGVHVIGRSRWSLVEDIFGGFASRQRVELVIVASTLTDVIVVPLDTFRQCVVIFRELPFRRHALRIEEIGRQTEASQLPISLSL